MNIGLIFSQGDHSLAFPHDHLGREGNEMMKDVRNGLLELGHTVIPIPANQNMIPTLLELKQKGKIDFIFNVADDGFTQDDTMAPDTQLEPQIPAVLDILGIPYSGSAHNCLSNCLDKHVTKLLLKSRGISTPNFQIFEETLYEVPEMVTVTYPVIVKPSREDGSIGISEKSVVERSEELLNMVNGIIQKYNQPALVEEYIQGREINVGIIGRTNLTVLPLSEIEFTLPSSEKNIVTYEGKWQEGTLNYTGTTAKCPTELDPHIEEEIKSLALDAFRSLGVRDYGRIDLRIDVNDRPFILEVNPNPDISRNAGLARMARAREMTYEDLLDRILTFSMVGA